MGEDRHPGTRPQQTGLALERFLEEARQRWHVPGAAIGIVKDNEIVMARGFGFADVQHQRPVTADTVFAIGSATKAFTTASVALLVEEGLLEWDRPVIKYLPWFRMADEHATHNATLRDFALHRSGLARHDFAWYGRSIARRDILASVEFLELAAGLRQEFLYNNHGYTLLGYLAGAVAGLTWEDLVHERVLAPLGMDSSAASSHQLPTTMDLARPYRRQEEEILAMAYRDIAAVGPAGSIHSTVTDMLAWVQLFLNGGRHGEQQVLQPSSTAELLRPQLVMPSGEYPELRFSSYGLGWMVEDYRGEQIVSHGGSIDGFTSIAAMVPQERIGIVVLTNMNGSPFPTEALYGIIDGLTGREPIPWGERLQEKLALMPAEVVRPPRQIPGTQPSRPLKAFAGLYEHPGYGQVSVKYLPDEDDLLFTFRDQQRHLEHWHYDVFKASIRGSAVDMDLPIHFTADADGSISALTIPLDVSVPAIRFAATADPSLREAAYLQTFAGQYEAMGMVVSVRVRPGQLELLIPGEAPLLLTPLRPGRFAVEGAAGYSVDFDETEGCIASLWLHQPNGSFEAKPVSEPS